METEIKKLRERIEELEKRLLKFEKTVEEKECMYQNYLENKFKRSHSKTVYGITDIETDDSIIEIKNWNRYKEALGQILAYNFSNSYKKKSFVYFFGKKPKKENLEEILVLFKSHQVNVVYLYINKNMDIEEEILLDVFYLKQDTSNFFKWLDENVIQKENSIVNLKDICSLCFDKELNRRDKGKYRKEIEKWIKSRFPNIDFACKESRQDGVKYNGWKGLCFRD